MEKSTEYFFWIHELEFLQPIYLYSFDMKIFESSL